MYLVTLVAAVISLSPWLRGSWDLWAQTWIAGALIALSGAWLGARVFIGAVPVPNLRHSMFVAVLALAVAVSAASSPLAGTALPGTLKWGIALWLLWAVPLVPEERRLIVENAWLSSAWVVFLLAFYQKFSGDAAVPEASLINPSVLAGWILMTLPLALERRRRALTAALAWALWWTGSLSAWIAVAVILIGVGLRRGGAWLGASLFAGLIALAGLAAKLATPSFLDRLFWWQAAGAMAEARPLLGFGPGAFAETFGAFRPWVGSLSSLFAHQYPLETAAELGLPFAVAWLAWIVKRWTETEGWAARAIALIMVYSIGEYALSIPALFWGLCYLLVAGYPMEPAWIQLPARIKPAALAAVAGATVVLFVGATAPWRCERMWIRAAEAGRAGRLEEAERLARGAERLFPDAPEPHRELARVELGRHARDGRSGSLWKAAAHLSDAAATNPYRAKAWSELEGVYRKLGRPDLGQRAGALTRGAAVQGMVR